MSRESFIDRDHVALLAQGLGARHLSAHLLRTLLANRPMRGLSLGFLKAESLGTAQRMGTFGAKDENP